jgi:hypothetical protein
MHTFLTPALDGYEWSASSNEKYPKLHTKQEAGCTPEPVTVVWRREKALSSGENETLIPGSPRPHPSHYNNYAIMTLLATKMT